MALITQQEERRPPPLRRSFLRVDHLNCRYIHIKNRIKEKEQSSSAPRPSRAQQEERRPTPLHQVGTSEVQQHEFQDHIPSFFHSPLSLSLLPFSLTFVHFPQFHMHNSIAQQEGRRPTPLFSLLSLSHLAFSLLSPFLPHFMNYLSIIQEMTLQSTAGGEERKGKERGEEEMEDAV